MTSTTARLAGALACLAPWAAHAQSVTTQQGVVQGATVAGISSWLGIPYAAPPVGALRWYPPQPPAPYGTRQATAFSSSCAQGLTQFGRAGTDEDCLYLNIYAPAGATAASKLPVMLWIHGGAFTSGEGSDYDGSPLVAQANMIVVTINYRLGLFGFFAHPDLAAGDPNGSSGNYGLQDQQAAMRWVKANIAGFGGNPASLTIFGESAGGASVEDQLTSPGTPHLHSAIIQSGAYASSLPTLAQAEATGVTTAATMLGCSGSGPQEALCLRAVPAQVLINAVNPLVLNISPNVDGTTLPLQPLQAINQGHFQHVPVINGSNHDEYRLFVGIDDIFGAGPQTAQSYVDAIDAAFGSYAATVLAAYPLSAYSSPNYAYAALVTDYTFACGAHLLNGLLSQYTPVYSYELNDPNAPDLFLPFDPNLPNLGDSHAADLPYIFPDITDPLLGLGPVAFTPNQQVLASSMRAFWTSLARYGRPLAPRAGLWLAYGVQHGVLSLVPPVPATEYGFVADHQCALWKPVLLSQAGLPATVPY